MKTFTFFSIIAGITFAMSAAGCSDADSENQLLPDDSRGEQSEISYDNRFPFHVWKDAEGEMRHDIDFENGPFPETDKLRNCIVGHGWMLDKCYTYDIADQKPDGTKVYKFHETSHILFIVGGDLSPRFFFKDNSNAVGYYKWWPTHESFDEVPTEPLFSREEHLYTYDNRTGVLDFYILKWYKIIYADKDNLWFGLPCYDRGFQFLHYVKADPEIVAGWDVEYDKHQSPLS